MGWAWSIGLKVYKKELGLPIGVLTDKREVDEELLELQHVVRAAASDDTLAEVYTLSSVDDDKDEEESFECPSLPSLFGEVVEAGIYFGDDPSESAQHAQCSDRMLGRDSIQNMLHFNVFVYLVLNECTAVIRKGTGVASLPGCHPPVRVGQTAAGEDRAPA
jgi:hypothetical protein